VTYRAVANGGLLGDLLAHERRRLAKALFSSPADDISDDIRSRFACATSDLCDCVRRCRSVPELIAEKAFRTTTAPGGQRGSETSRTMTRPLRLWRTCFTLGAGSSRAADTLSAAAGAE
jgi:hypothetical protein